MKQEDVIWRQIVDANRTWMNGRAEDIGTLFDEHAILAFVDTKERRVGREAMVRTYVEHCQRVDTLEFRELEHSVDIAGDTAVATYRFFMKYDANGVAVEESGHEILVFSHSEPGWRVVWRTRIPESVNRPIESKGP